MFSFRKCCLLKLARFSLPVNNFKSETIICTSLYRVCNMSCVLTYPHKFFYTFSLGSFCFLSVGHTQKRFRFQKVFYLKTKKKKQKHLRECVWYQYDLRDRSWQTNSGGNRRLVYLYSKEINDNFYGLPQKIFTLLMWNECLRFPRKNGVKWIFFTRIEREREYMFFTGIEKHKSNWILFYIHIYKRSSNKCFYTHHPAREREREREKNGSILFMS